jgi:hypothetical protein
METLESAVSLRHTLATLAYRTARAVENAPPDFATFGRSDDPRTPARILAHMGDLMDWAISLVQDNQKWQDSAPQPWNDEVARFFSSLAELDRALSNATLDARTTNRLFQGPIADALTHAGQIAMLRRMAGYAIRGENYFVANIESGRVGADQPAPRKSF